MVDAVTDSNFQEEVLNFPGVVLIDFWAEWCGPCKAVAPIIQNIATKYSTNNQVKVRKLDVDENPQTQSKYHVLSIPSLLVFKNGELFSTLVGLKPENVIEEELKSALS